MNNTEVLNEQDIRLQVAKLAEACGIDLSAYGNASPTKLITEVIVQATEVLQTSTRIAMTERNPATAMEFRSILGLASLTGFAPATMLKASAGKIKLSMKDTMTVEVAQHAKLRSDDNIYYYVVLPAESVLAKDGDELYVKQGIIKQVSYSATGEHLESFNLPAENFVDFDSIDVTVDNVRLTVGKSVDDDAQCIAMLGYDGQMQIVIKKTVLLQPGQSVVITYADCIGIGGDNLNVDTYMQASNFAYAGDADVTKQIEILVSEPIIGGTDFENLYKDMALQIQASGKNNLIGNKEQLIAYVNRYKQYTVQNSELADGILNLYCLRNLQFTVRKQSYWDAVNDLNLTTADITALQNHLNNLDIKSASILCRVQHAQPEHCKLKVTIAGAADITEVMQVVEAYLAEQFNDRCYEVGTLYKALMNINYVNQCFVQFAGNTNDFGSAVPRNANNILICSGADVTINGVTHRYGNYIADVQPTVSDEIKQLTEHRIAENYINTDNV